MNDYGLILWVHAAMDVVVVAWAWWWARRTVARLEGQHAAMRNDHTDIRKIQTIPTRDAVLMARMDMEVGDVVQELREIRTVLQAILGREAMTARNPCADAETLR